MRLMLEPVISTRGIGLSVGASWAKAGAATPIRAIMYASFFNFILGPR